MCLRIETALSARIERLGYGTGHHILEVQVKGGDWGESGPVVGE
ncbi:hypothetical protein [Streptomyces sp. NBC_01320]|nr:hypothetical protein OG395_55955 [Streptomyces sp. NBC_01320]